MFFSPYPYPQTCSKTTCVPSFCCNRFFFQTTCVALWVGWFFFTSAETSSLYVFRLVMKYMVDKNTFDIYNLYKFTNLSKTKLQYTDIFCIPQRAQMKRRSYSGYTWTMLKPLKGKFDIHFISNENFKTYFYVFLSLT